MEEAILAEPAKWKYFCHISTRVCTKGGEGDLSSNTQLRKDVWILVLISFKRQLLPIPKKIRSDLTRNCLSRELGCGNLDVIVIAHWRDIIGGSLYIGRLLVRLHCKLCSVIFSIEVYIYVLCIM